MLIETRTRQDGPGTRSPWASGAASSGGWSRDFDLRGGLGVEGARAAVRAGSRAERPQGDVLDLARREVKVVVDGLEVADRQLDRDGEAARPERCLPEVLREGRGGDLEREVALAG